MPNEYIFIGIGFLALILSSIFLLKVHLIISYDNGLLIYLKILCFERILVSSNDKNDKKRSRRLKRDDDWVLLGLYSHRVDILDLIRDFWKKLHFENIFLNIIIGGNDASQAALSHSLALQATYYLLCFLENTSNLHIDNINVSILPDFISSEKKVAGRVVIYARFLPAVFLIYRIRRLVLVIKGENYERSN